MGDGCRLGTLRFAYPARAAHRSSVGDGYSNGFHVCLAEECTYDRAELTHKVNLFDLHHKYADVMHVDEVVTHLDATRLLRAAE